jgi:hypothetical protein
VPLRDLNLDKIAVEINTMSKINGKTAEVYEASQTP